LDFDSSLIIRLVVQLIIRLVVNYQLQADNPADNPAVSFVVIYAYIITEDIDIDMLSRDERTMDCIMHRLLGENAIY